MPHYNFLDLSPVDFEELTRDLLQEHLGVTLESFKEGRDSGIDLRYSKNNSNNIIVQCKRYSSITDLKKNLKKELKKVIKLAPIRYFIVTSVDLTPKYKKDIKDIFKGIKLKQKDILSKKDINGLLGKYPNIEKRQFKLWLNSTAVLDKFLHSDIYNRSDFEQEVIKREIKIYVNNDSNNEALEILNNNNYVIISGIPGIGKTTLARMLLYTYLLNGWEIIPITEDIKEADEIFQEGKAQIFYYDDFLGTNFLVELKSKNEDKRIISFIERVNKSKDKKLILTTREYILNQAKDKFELLQNNAIEIGKCTIDLKKYTKLIKGRILYNHLFYSELEYSYKLEILKDNRFLNIINHPNYNPRLIQYLTDVKFLKDKPSNDYYSFFMENLTNPYEIWNYAFSSHISTLSRYLLLVFLSMSDPAFKEDLYLAVSSFCTINSKYYGIVLNEVEFNKSLKECESTFIKIEKIENNRIIIDFQNPSIKDFLIFYLKTHKEQVKHLINSSIFFNQFFDIYSTESFNQTVFVDEELKRLIFSKIKKGINSLSISTLNPLYNFKDHDYAWGKRNLSKIERLDELSQFYDLSSSTYVLDYLYNEFMKIKPEEVDYVTLTYYLNLIKNINSYLKLDGEKIIVDMFSKYQIDFFEDINMIKRLEKIFPDEYHEFIRNNNKEVELLLDKVISYEFSNLHSTSRNKVDDFIEEIEKIESDFGFYIKNYRDDALDLIPENDEEEKKKEIISIPHSEDTPRDDDETIINMFGSLMTIIK
jgi:Restriction endonuclease